MLKRPTRQPHFNPGTVLNHRTFAQAYSFLASAGGRQAYTTAKGTPFTAEAGTVGRGDHEGAPVIIFRRDGEGN